MELKLCDTCKRPYTADKGGCPHCPELYTWDQESYANLGCLLLMVVPVFLLVLFWIFMLFGAFIR